MDGQVKVLEVDGSKDAAFSIVHSLETSSSVTCAQYFCFDKQVFLVFAFEDGSMHVYDYTKMEPQGSYKR